MQHSEFAKFFTYCYKSQLTVFADESIVHCHVDKSTYFNYIIINSKVATKFSANS